MRRPARAAAPGGPSGPSGPGGPGGEPGNRPAEGPAPGPGSGCAASGPAPSPAPGARPAHAASEAAPGAAPGPAPAKGPAPGPAPGTRSDPGSGCGSALGPLSGPVSGAGSGSGAAPSPAPGGTRTGVPSDGASGTASGTVSGTRPGAGSGAVSGSVPAPGTRPSDVTSDVAAGPAPDAVTGLTAGPASGTGPGAVPGPRRIAFAPVDEFHRHLREDGVPDTIHVEVHLTGRADPERLRAAFHEALRRHPRALVREIPGRWYRRRYAWELTGAPDHDPVAFAGEGQTVLARVRSRSLAEAPPLTGSPPVRLDIVHLPEGTALVLAAAHTAMDGISCVQLLTTTAERYAAQAAAPEAPQVPRPAGGSGPPGVHVPRDSGVPATAKDAAPRGPARPVPVAADGGVRGGGNGMLLVELPVPRRPPTGAEGGPTVNDVLLAATYLTVARWNRMHGCPAGPVRISMPVDDRPRATEPANPTEPAIIGNRTRLPEIDFAPDERADEVTLTSRHPDPEALRRLLHRTARRTRAVKAQARPPLGAAGILLTAPWLPIGIKAPLTRGVRAAATGWISTTLFSNLGVVRHPLDFGGGAGRARALWFSSPVRMPRGFTVTAATVGGRLNVAFCYTRELLDDAAVSVLSRLYTESLTALDTAHDGTAPDDTTAAGRTA